MGHSRTGPCDWIECVHGLPDCIHTGISWLPGTKTRNSTVCSRAKVDETGGVVPAANPIASIADRVFESYPDRFPYSYYLGKLCEFEVVYISSLDGPGPIRITIEPPGSIELHTTALGKVLLAYQAPEFIQEFLEKCVLKSYTPRTVTNPEELIAQIQAVKIQGYATNDGEHYEDIGAVAAPVFDNKSQVTAGVSLAYPRHHVIEGRLDILNAIQVAQEIAVEITIRSGGITPKGQMAN